jgi:hypothetical protein
VLSDQLFFNEEFVELTDNRWRRSANDGAFHPGRLRFSFVRVSDCGGFVADWLNMLFPLFGEFRLRKVGCLSKNEHFLSWGDAKRMGQCGSVPTQRLPPTTLFEIMAKPKPLTRSEETLEELHRLRAAKN